MARDRAGDQSQRGASLTSLSDRFRSRPGTEERQQEEEAFRREAPEQASPQQQPQPQQQEPQQERPAQRQSPAQRAASVIDAHSTFDGRFETGQDLRVEGTVSGEIICRGALYIEQNAVARVKRVEAREVHVFGTLEGEIECSEKLVLAETGHISGTIRTGTLVVHEGAIMSGTIETGENAGESTASAKRPARRQRAEGESKGQEPSFSLSALDAEESQSAS